MIERRRNKKIYKRVGNNVLDRVPKISVVIPAYNSAEHIEETLESALNQKFNEHEIVLINDGSPDTETFEAKIQKYLDRITYIRQPNTGAGPARNLGISHARGEYIAFLDADDVWQPDYLATQYLYLVRNELDMVYADAWLIGMASAYRRTFMETAPSNGVCDFNAILDLKCNVITSGTVARKSVIEKAGLFEPERVRAHDFHLWLRIAKTGAKIGYQKKVFLKYRVATTGLSGDSISRIERERDAFLRVADTIDLNLEQREIVHRRIADLEADLAVEQGKSFLLSGDYPEAVIAFRVANRHRNSLKLSAITLLARLAPGALLNYYRRYRKEELLLVRRQA